MVKPRAMIRFFLKALGFAYFFAAFLSFEMISPVAFAGKDTSPPLPFNAPDEAHELAEARREMREAMIKNYSKLMDAAALELANRFVDPFAEILKRSGQVAEVKPHNDLLGYRPLRTREEALAILEVVRKISLNKDILLKISDIYAFNKAKRAKNIKKGVKIAIAILVIAAIIGALAMLAASGSGSSVSASGSTASSSLKSSDSSSDNFWKSWFRWAMFDSGTRMTSDIATAFVHTSSTPEFTFFEDQLHLIPAEKIHEEFGKMLKSNPFFQKFLDHLFSLLKKRTDISIPLRYRLLGSRKWMAHQVEQFLLTPSALSGTSFDEVDKNKIPAEQLAMLIGTQDFSIEHIERVITQAFGGQGCGEEFLRDQGQFEGLLTELLSAEEDDTSRPNTSRQQERQ